MCFWAVKRWICPLERRYLKSQSSQFRRIQLQLKTKATHLLDFLEATCFSEFHSFETGALKWTYKNGTKNLLNLLHSGTTNDTPKYRSLLI